MCHSLECDSAHATGRGTLFTCTLVYHPPVPGFTIPFTPIVVELAEDPRIVSDLLDVAPQDVRIGMRVALTFTPTPTGDVLPHFRGTT